MPVFFIVLGIAAVVLLATAGHHSRAQQHPHREHPPGARLVELDSDLPRTLVDEVLVALGHDEDPGRLEALAHSLSGRYPLSAGELQRKASALRAGGAQTAHAPAGDGGAPLDAATVLQAAMRALVEETDPVVLTGFAESIRAHYPAAAEILMARAHALLLPTATPSDAHAAAASPIEVPS